MVTTEILESTPIPPLSTTTRMTVRIFPIAMSLKEGMKRAQLSMLMILQVRVEWSKFKV
jgi:hypothetical protein